LEFELIDSYLQEQFVGKDPNYNKVGRDIFKAIKDKWKDKIGYIPLRPMALLQATEPNSDVIKGLSCSEPNDLLLNNFGTMLSSCINTGGNVRRDVVSQDGITRTIHFQETGNIRMCFATETSPVALSLGGQLQIGFGDSGGGPWNPNRSDFKLREQFAALPQANFFPVTTPVWISMDQEVILSGQINNVTGNFVVGECGMFCFWRLGFSTTRVLVMISHDKTGLAVNDGENIKTTYTWSLS
jgi:hypothetical protein